MPARLSANAVRVLETRYLRRDAVTGALIETPDELFQRVARAVADAELLHGKASDARRWEERFYCQMSELAFIPNSPTLMNAGTALGQLSACFVLPVEDSMESIFGTLHDMAQIQRTGGGTGFSFSRLRPAGSLLSSTRGEASGPLGFMRIYDCATENIKQGGRRRGANMGVLRADHPDVEAFIRAKVDVSEGTSQPLRNFNLSVGVTDELMRAVESGGDVPVRHPLTGHVVGRRSARALFHSICEAAWSAGDPGLLFLDAVNRANPTPALGVIESTNPCGEVPLLPNEACNLGSINLARLVVRGGEGAGRAAIDWDELREQVHDGVRFLDDIVSVTRLPLEAVRSMTRANRKIGLGVMGFAEALIRLGVSYADTRAVELARQIMGFIAREARVASVRLAEDRGVFPNWSRSVFVASGMRLRNATLTSIAPTGTLAILANTSSGIEPLFALAYRRRALDGETLVELNQLFLDDAERRGLHTGRLIARLSERGRLSDVPDIPAPLRRLYATALEVPAEQHIAVQSAFQAHVDNAVSKTVNLPADATVADVDRVYRLAFAQGCKGVTVFRYGSRSSQVLELGVDQSPTEWEHFSRCDPGSCRL
jgi:ribonucleoside-diphosphate reductase alpha chain